MLKSFGVLPHQWKREDPKLIEALLIIDEEVQRYEEEVTERESRRWRLM